MAVNPVSDAWSVDVNVNINTAVVQPPSFQNGMIVCVLQDSFVPSSFGSNLTKNYSDYASISSDFSPKEQSAITSGDTLQANRIHSFLEACFDYFSQNPTPNSLLVGIASYTGVAPVNYTTSLTDIANENNSWYGFVIADQILPQSYSYVNVRLTCSGAITLPKGTVVTPKTATQYYTTLEEYVLSAGNYPYSFNVPFYSTDATTAVPGATFTAISPTIVNVTAVTNTLPAINNCSGIMTGPGSVSSALTSLRGPYGAKKCLLDTDDVTYAGICQDLAGNKDLIINYYVYNNQSHYSSLSYSLSGACLSAYFQDIFSSGVGLKSYGYQKLSGIPKDFTVTTANIGDVTQPGGVDNLIGWNNNVYASLSISSMQYGLVSSSTNNQLVYVDQVVGADYLQAVVQTDLITLLNSQPNNSLLYTNSGIQKIVNTFKTSLTKCVNLNIIQPYADSDISYVTAENVTAADKTARIYPYLSANLTFVSRIQRITVNVNLSLGSGA